MILPGFLMPLFWDADKDIDPEKRWFFIIERVLEHGNIEAVGWVFSSYSRQQIAEVVKNSLALSTKTLHCWSKHFGLSETDHLLEGLISDDARQVLSRLGGSGILDGFYLGGSTGISLYLGHRLSHDLNFFTIQEFDPTELQQQLNELGSFVFTGSSWGDLQGIFQGVHLTFTYDRHPLLFPANTFCQVKVAHIVDLALMKLAAITQRGFNTDYLDLYFIARQLASLESLLERYPEKYPVGDPYSVIKSLGYFDDADKQPLPQTIKEIDWAEVKRFFSSAQQNLLVRFSSREVPHRVSAPL